MHEGEISVDDPRAADARGLLERHLAFANTHSRPEDVHALDVAGLLDPVITFYSFRLNGELLGVGALKRLDEEHVELKSMHTAEKARGRGVGRAMLEHLLAVARERGFTRVSLETGSMAAFGPPGRCTRKPVSPSARRSATISRPRTAHAWLSRSRAMLRRAPRGHR